MPKIKEVIFLTESSFSQRDFERYGIQVIRDNGFALQVWDLTPFLHKQAFCEGAAGSYSGYRIFYNKQEALKAINELDKAASFIVSLLGYNFKTWRVFKAISRRQIPYAIFLANGVPIPENKLSKEKIKNALKLLKRPMLFARKLVKAGVLDKIHRLARAGQADMLLLGGEKTFSLYAGYFPVGRRTEKLWLHSLDYDLYLRARNNTSRMLENKFAVFLDEYTPFHPDYLLLDVEPFSSPQEYYPALRRFFDYLEKISGIPVVIAAHPRSDYERHPDFFEGRKVVKGKTLELIRDAEFVIAHSSTSLNAAVLFRKGVLFITTDKLCGSPQGPIIDLMAGLLGKTVINIDRGLDIKLENEFRIDAFAYQEYRNDYIKKEGSEELPFWQLFANRLKLAGLLNQGARNE